MHGFFAGFNWLFDRLSHGYGSVTRRLVRLTAVVLVVYAGLIALTGWQFERAPTGFIPPQDQGYLITVIQLPPGSSLARTDAVVRQAAEIALDTPGVIHAVSFAGFDGATFTNASNGGAIFTPLAPFAERAAKGLSATNILADLLKRYSVIQEAFIVVVMPPPVRGIGTAGGFKMMVQDRRGRGLQALETATQALVAAANQTPGLLNVFSLFNTRTPKIYADIDRVKAEMLGVTPEQVFEALEVYIGSIYVNDFNLLGRTFRVTAQADAPFRKDLREVSRLKTRSDQGAMVPLGSVATFRDISGPYRVPRYNLYPAAEVQGSAAPGTSTGTALAKMEDLADAAVARRLRLRMDRARAAGEAGWRWPAGVRRLGGVRVPSARGAVRKLAPAAGGDPDRTDVSAGRGQRAAAARHGCQHPRPDRLRRAGRARRQERDPDRRVRAAGRGARARPLRGRDRGRTNQAAPDPDDLVRVHSRRGAADAGDRRGRRDAPVARHRGVLRHARRHLLRPDLHAGVLRGVPAPRPAAPAT